MESATRILVSWRNPAPVCRCGWLINILQAAGLPFVQDRLRRMPVLRANRLFNLQNRHGAHQDPARKHLKGVKIAIMGLHRQRPRGEMADADFGYVGGRHPVKSIFTSAKTPIKFNNSGKRKAVGAPGGFDPRTRKNGLNRRS